MNLWGIVDKYEETFFPNVDLKVKNMKDVQKRNIFVDNQFVHIRSCKRPAEIWKILCNIYVLMNLSNVFFSCAATCVCAKCKKMMVCWITSTRLWHL